MKQSKDSKRKAQKNKQEDGRTSSSAPTELQGAFEQLVEQLESLYSEAGQLKSLAAYTDIVLRKPTEFASAPLEASQERNYEFPFETESEQIHPGVSFVDFDPVTTWKEYLRIPKGDKIPALQSQCGSDHWKELSDATQEVREAILRVAGARASDAIRVSDAVDHLHLPTPKSDGLEVSVLQRDISWLIFLVRSLARHCRIMGDFGAGRELLSAAKVAWIGETLSRRAEALSRSADFFNIHLKRHPQKFLRPDQNRALERLFTKISQDVRGVTRQYSPPDMAILMGVSASTVRRCIKNLEEKGELKVQLPTRESGLKYVKKEYTQDEFRRIQSYHRSLPSRWGGSDKLD